MDQSNLVVIMCDQLKSSVLSTPGLIFKPNLDTLFEQSIVFSHAFTPYPVCVPSRTTFFTGQYSHNTGCRDNSILLNPSIVHLVNVLAHNGYRMGLSGKNHCFLPSDLGLFEMVYEVGHRGPNVPRDTNEERLVQFLSQDTILRGSYASTVSPFPENQQTTALVANEAIRFLETSDERPFFLLVSFPDPHPPFQVAESYFSLYQSEEIRLPQSFRESLNDKPIRQQVARHMFGMTSATEEGMREVMQVYYGMVSHIDKEIGRILDFLEQRGLSGNTTVIFTSDHGEYLGEHGLIRKSNALYDCLTRVPLTIRSPEMKGKLVDDLIETTDVFPTILEVLGIHLTEEQSLSIQGRSFYNILEDNLDYTPRNMIFGEVGTEGKSPSWEDLKDVPKDPLDSRFVPWGARQMAWSGKGKMVRTKRWKYVFYSDDRHELYDITTDPGEMVNLYGQQEYRHVVEELRYQLLDWCINTENRSISRRFVDGLTV